MEGPYLDLTSTTGGAEIKLGHPIEEGPISGGVLKALVNSFDQSFSNKVGKALNLLYRFKPIS